MRIESNVIQQSNAGLHPDDKLISQRALLVRESPAALSKRVHKPFRCGHLLAHEIWNTSGRFSPRRCCTHSCSSINSLHLLTSTRPGSDRFRSGKPEISWNTLKCRQGGTTSSGRHTHFNCPHLLSPAHSSACPSSACDPNIPPQASFFSLATRHTLALLFLG